MTLTAYLDESKRRGVTFAAVIIGSEMINEARKQARSFRSPGNRRLHFVHERDMVRRAVLRAIHTLGPSVLIVSCASGRPIEARAQALASTTTALVNVGVTRMVIERDGPLVARDRRTIAQALRTQGAIDHMQYVHLAAVEEPLLWIADAVAWSWSRGGGWRRMVEGMEPRVIRC